MRNCFLNTGGVNIGGRRNKCIRFSDDMALLTKDKRMLKNMLAELDDKCDDYGMKINKIRQRPLLSEENQRR